MRDGIISRMMQKGIVLFHGGRRWEGGPQMRPPKEGRYECGPGIYLTTGADTAQRYARAGGVITLVTLDPQVRFLEDAPGMPLAQLRDFAGTFPGLAASVRAGLDADLIRVATRQRHGRHAQGASVSGDEPLDAECIKPAILLNLLVNAEAINGKKGLAFAQWLSDRGIDASVHQANGVSQYEDWTVIFNPQAITHWHTLSQKDIDWGNNSHLPSVTAQLEALRNPEANRAVNRERLRISG